MKRTLFSIISTGILIIALNGNANAQIALNKSAIRNDHFITAKSSINRDKLSSENAIHYRTLKDFEKRFNHTSNVIWEVTDKSYFASFSTDSIPTTVAYNKKGKWHYTTQRYTEQHLPAGIRARVKSVYYDYSILNICEVQVPQEENPIYIVNLEHNQHYKTVRVCADDMDVIANLYPYKHN